MKKKYFIPILSMIILLIVISLGVKAAEDIPSWPNYTIEEYYDQCPYGDAVIVPKKAMPTLNNYSGIRVDCVIWDIHTNMWKTITYNWKTKEYLITRYSPQEYDIHTMLGLLTVDFLGQVTVEFKK